MRTYALFLLVSACVISSCKVQREVTTQRDTVLVTELRTLVDTLELYKDTVIFQDRVKLQIEYRDKFVRVKADCLPDTIRVRQTIVKTNLKELEASRKWVGSLFMVALVLFILLLLKK